MTINQVIGMSHGKQEPMESGCYHDIIHCKIILTTSFILPSPRWRIRKTIGKNTPDFCHQFTHFFGLIFQKPLTCIRNNIVLHSYFNLKCKENWRKAVYHASSASVQCVVSYARGGGGGCDVILPDKLITGDIKICVQNKIFSRVRTTDPTFWAVCNQNQTIIFVQPYLSKFRRVVGECLITLPWKLTLAISFCFIIMSCSA